MNVQLAMNINYVFQNLLIFYEILGCYVLIQIRSLENDMTADFFIVFVLFVNTYNFWSRLRLFRASPQFVVYIIKCDKSIHKL